MRAPLGSHCCRSSGWTRQVYADVRVWILLNAVVHYKRFPIFLPSPSPFLFQERGLWTNLAICHYHRKKNGLAFPEQHFPFSRHLVKLRLGHHRYWAPP